MGMFQSTDTPGLSTGAFNTAASGFQNVQDNAAPSLRVHDTAADRVSSRMAAKQRGDERAFRGRFGGMGRSLSGGMNSALAQNRIGNTSALGSSLADLENVFEQSRQQSMSNINQASQGLGQLGTSYADQVNAGNKTAYDYEIGTGVNENNAFRNKFEKEQGEIKLGIDQGELDFRGTELGVRDKKDQRDQLLDFFAQFAPDGANTQFVGSQAFRDRKGGEYQSIIDRLFGAFNG